MNRQEFIEKIASTVVELCDLFEYDYPSAIIAQACHESGFGTSEKSEYNNYFGLKYKANRVTCNSGFFTAGGFEEIEGKYVPIETDWYAFASAEEAVLGYFQFISSASRYDNLKYAESAREYLDIIQSDGYATDSKYADKCYALVVQYGLTEFDEILAEKRSRQVVSDAQVTPEEIIKAKVCIDAGHYAKYNRSPGIPEYYESEMVWDLSQRQQRYLEGKGISVVPTREDQKKDLALYDRGMKSKGCDLFISNHSNAVGSGMNETTDHVAVYHLVDDTTTDIDEKSKIFSEIIAPVIAEVMGVKKGYKILTRKSSNDRNKDGIMNDNYYGVLHGARMANTPGVILEHSFHTNSNAVRWLLNKDNLERLAKAEADCIAEYFKKMGFAVSTGNSGESAEKPSVPETPAKGILYRVRVSWQDASSQIGAFRNWSYAVAACKEGYYIFDEEGNVLYPLSVSEEDVKPTVDLEVIARKVLRGDYGNGAARRQALEAEGYDYDEVQALVNKLSGKSSTSSSKLSVTEVALLVIRGLYGNGQARKKKLEAEGYNYAEVQAEVNRLYKKK